MTDKREALYERSDADFAAAVARVDSSPAPQQEQAAPVLPTWEECRVAVKNCNATALQRFIYENEPADVGILDAHTEAEFRTMLSDVLREALNASPPKETT